MLRPTTLRKAAADGGGSGRRYFKKVLVANRGEIACRVMRTCKRLGIQTVAIYSQADAKAKHVRLADEAYCVGPPPSKDSYLRVDTILDVVRRSGADAVHPGYGFLSENSTFSRALADHGVTFVGPTEKAIHAMGDKIESKRLARSLQVSTIPGYDGEIQSEEHLLQVTKQVGYPVMMKASAGGGGKGMRVAWNDDEALKGFRLSKSEAAAAFGDDRMLVEKFVEEPRHIEIQILGDKLGNVLYLPERECSIQRRNQKVIEEAPSTFVHPEMRRAMGEQAAMLARGVQYHTAGTVEMMVDKHRNFYFLEMNTRLQVEHPITELITGLDLVEEMLRAAAGLPLSVRQEDIKIRGWATESRVYAEDPLNNFLPTIGRLSRYEEPLEVEGVRVDSGIVAGSEISVYYDPLIAKLCTWGETRKESISRMRDALDAYVIRGLGRTNVNFLRDTMLHPKYLSGDITTKFIEQEYKNGYLGHQLTDAEKQEILATTAIMHSAKQLQLHGRPHDTPVAQEEWVITLHEPHPQGSSPTAAAGAPSGVPDTVARVTLTSQRKEQGRQEFTGTITVLEQQQQPAAAAVGKGGKGAAAPAKEVPVEGHGTGCFRLVTPWSPAQQLFRFTFEGSAAGATPAEGGSGKWKYSQLVARAGYHYTVQHVGTHYQLTATTVAEHEAGRFMLPPPKADHSKRLESPMPGVLVELLVKPGDRVKAGSPVATLEAMKMRNVLTAAADGIVKATPAKVGANVDEGDVLVEFQ